MAVEAFNDFRAVFISDLHVGWDKVSELHLQRFLRNLRTRNLYLVGDVLEWMFRPTGTSPTR
jgi:UDP-2,3-diacylglucosamine pyrophosphatase LpxH